MFRENVYQPDSDDPTRTQTFPIAVGLYHLTDGCLYADLLQKSKDDWDVI